MNKALNVGFLVALLCCMNAFCEETTKVPEWIPVMPDLELKVENAKKIEKGEEVILFGKTAKAPKDVAEFFSAAFEKSGFDKTKFNVEHIAEDGNAQENMKFIEGKKIWFFSARQDKGKSETLVSVVYKALTE